MTNYTIITENEEQTLKLAEKVAKKIKNGGILCLIGDLGTGKTTFTKGIAQALGINKFSIKSPTYTYIRKHDNGKFKLYHIDLYRINEADELLLQEINEIAENPKNIIIIEWADKLKNNLPTKRMNLPELTPGVSSVSSFACRPSGDQYSSTDFSEARFFLQRELHASARREREQGEQSGFASCEPKRAYKIDIKFKYIDKTKREISIIPRC